MTEAGKEVRLVGRGESTTSTGEVAAHGRMSGLKHIGPVSVSFAIAAFSTISSIVLVANPGFFNHDELQTGDFISHAGILAYVRQFARIQSAPNFGSPVRPVSFILEGIFAIAMYRAPVVTHLCDVLLNAAVVVALYWLLRSLAVSRSMSLLSAILFSCSPLATFAVGWAGALMDPTFVLFMLLTALLTAAFFRGLRVLAGIGLLATLAVLSKETALILPVVIALLSWHCARISGGLFLPKEVVAPFAITLFPMLAYCAVRAPAIAASLAGEGNGHYQVSLHNVGSNLLTYFAYPFAPSLTEAVNVVFLTSATLALAVSLHALLVLLIGMTAGVRQGVLYVFCFLLPLIPILTIAGKSSQYLYASGLAVSVGLAAVLHSAWITRRWLVLAPALLLCGVLLDHTVNNQAHIYGIGRCMDRAMTSLEANYLRAGKPSHIAFDIDPGAPGHIINRIITGRDHIGPYYPIEMQVLEKDQAAPEGALNLRFSPDCLVY